MQRRGHGRRVRVDHVETGGTPGLEFPAENTLVKAARARHVVGVDRKMSYAGHVLAVPFSIDSTQWNPCRDYAILPIDADFPPQGRQHGGGTQLWRRLPRWAD